MQHTDVDAAALVNEIAAEMAPNRLDRASLLWCRGLHRLCKLLQGIEDRALLDGACLWEEVAVPGPCGVEIRVTATPAQHGPDGTEGLTGPVTGFVVSAADLPTVYVSGDNASMHVVDLVAERFPVIDIAVLFAGAAQTPLLGDAYLTLTSADATQAARRLAARWVIPAHFNSWSHYHEGADRLRTAFAEAKLSDRLVLLTPGDQVTVGHEGLHRDSRYSASTSHVAPAREVRSNSSGA